MPSKPNPIPRRDFIRRAAIAGGVLTGMGVFADRVDARTSPISRMSQAGRQASYQQPNIVFIVVDELRLPTVFPAGISTRDEFLATFMPNLHELWSNGVKFEGHYTSGTACSPGRAAFVSGLYPHQNWCLQTRKGAGGLGPNAPSMKTAFPTYGKVLRDAGYDTPYVGKWHLSDAPASPTAEGASSYLQDYGFQGFTMPDVVGGNGDGYFYDKQIAKTATDWLKRRRAADGPFCLTASFVNPHDKEYFWAGTEATRYDALFADAGQTPSTVYTEVPTQDSPDTYGYPTLPPNWESGATLAANKPPTQTFVRDFSGLIWGGVSDDPAQDDFSLELYGSQPAPGQAPPYYVGLAPYSYWSKALDSYTQVMGEVDRHIGSVVAAVPEDLRSNTVFIMTSDHGEYAGAHGLVSNKACSVYEEAFNVPLIVSDPTGRFTGRTDIPRRQLTASVDLLPLMANLAYGGAGWMTGDLATIYAERLDLAPLLVDPGAAGRDHLVISCDEVVPEFFNFNDSQRHVLGVRTPNAKLGYYANWDTGTANIDPSSVVIEYYDYDAAGNTLEMDNLGVTPDSTALAELLINQYLPQQMQQTLPGAMQAASTAARQEYIAYVAVLDALTGAQMSGNIGGHTGMGNPF